MIADIGAHGAHISTRHPVLAHRPAALLVTCRRTMQNRLNPGWLAYFAGHLSVAARAESARRPRLARVARGAGLRVIRRDPGLFRLANEGRGIEDRP